MLTKHVVKWLNRAQIRAYDLKNGWKVFLVLFVLLGTVLSVPILLAESVWDFIQKRS